MSSDPSRDPETSAHTPHGWGRGAGSVSWPVATWVTPFVPGVALAVLALVGSGGALGSSGQTGGYGAGAAIAAGIALAGVAMVLLPSRHARGAGLGLVVGGAVTGLGWLVVMAS